MGNFDGDVALADVCDVVIILSESEIYPNSREYFSSVVDSF